MTMRFLVVQTGETIWEAQQRVDSLAGVPLTEQGKTSIAQIAEQLAPHRPTVLYASTGESEQETANILATRLEVRVRTDLRLGGIDFGLWQGLSVSDIRRRQPRLHKQWLESPSGVRPPNGESLQEVQDRLREAMRDILKKSKRDMPVFVLRPVALGVLRCLLEKAELDDVWKFVDRDFTWTSYDVDEKKLLLPA